MKPNFHVMSFPSIDPSCEVMDNDNPYLSLFYRALKPFGIANVFKANIEIKWLRENASRLQAIHINWPEFIWRGYGSRAFRIAQRKGLPWSDIIYEHAEPIRCAFGYWSLKRYLLYAKRLGLKIIWTYHNSLPHRIASGIERVGYAFMSQVSDLIIVHGVAARRQFVKTYGREDGIVIMPIGNFDNVFPEPRPRKESLQRLGLDPAKPTLAMIGGLRKNKGIEKAANAVIALDGRVQFIIAGKATSQYDIAPLANMIREKPYIRFLPTSTSNQEYSDLVSASDGILLPYQDITSSAAALSAMTLGRGIITTPLPLFRELLALNCSAGVIAEDFGVKSISEAIEIYFSGSAAARGVAARLVADEFAWDRVIQPVAAAIHAMGS